MAIEIRDAERWMLPQLEQLEEACFSVPWTQEQLLGQFPDDNHLFLTAVEGENVLGYVGMMHVLDEGYISNVAVAPAYRRRGLGDRLIGELTERAKALCLAFVTLEVRESNAPAIALYAKRGFTAAGLRRNYYEKPKENAVLMTLFLESNKQ